MGEFSARQVGFARNAFAAALLLSSCGGRAEAPGAPAQDGGNPLVCAPFTGCGGDLTGTWQALTDCYDAAQMSLACETIVHESATTRGTVRFAADGTYQRNEMSEVVYTMHSPDSCTSSTCPELEASIQALLLQQGGGMTTCAHEVDTCSCHIDAQTTNLSTGRYAVNGNLVTFTLDANSGTTMLNDYCVTGDTLILHQAGGGGLTLLRQ